MIRIALAVALGIWMALDPNAQSVDARPLLAGVLLISLFIIRIPSRSEVATPAEPTVVPPMPPMFAPQTRDKTRSSL